MKPRDKIARELLTHGWHVQWFSIAEGHWRHEDVYRWSAYVARVPKAVLEECIVVHCWLPMTLAARFGFDLIQDKEVWGGFEARVKIPDGTSANSWARRKPNMKAHKLGKTL